MSQDLTVNLVPHHFSARIATHYTGRNEETKKQEEGRNEETEKRSKKKKKTKIRAHLFV